jgi:hypothetical protein
LDPIGEFMRGLDAVGERRPLPFELEVDAMAGHRVADVALLLGLILAFWGLGRLLRAGLPAMRPFVFASGMTGILLLFFTNTAFYMVAGVAVDDEKVTLRTHLGGDEVMKWSELTTVELDGGSLYPAFTDDASLVLVGKDDARIELPRFVPGVGAVAAEVAHRMGRTAPMGQTGPTGGAPPLPTPGASP